MIEEKKIEYITLEWRDMTVVEYHARIPSLERFESDTFQTKRQRVAKVMRGLSLSL